VIVFVSDGVHGKAQTRGALLMTKSAARKPAAARRQDRKCELSIGRILMPSHPKLLGLMRVFF
jgi:hypothetical protein